MGVHLDDISTCVSTATAESRKIPLLPKER
jgi:hypothetical protein